MIAILLTLACGGEPQTPTPGPPPKTLDLPNIILVTLDTTRADAMGSYGGVEGISPAFDQWAAKGAQFDWAFSHSPTTLSAHSSILTGLDPHGHAVPRNGFPLDEIFITLPEFLRDEGYDTLGVVAASVINKEMGMAQGFRLFDDDNPHDMGRRHEDRADSVTRRAKKLVDQRIKERPIFLWTHYYDAHSPYEAPQDFQARFTDPNHNTPVERGKHYRKLADQIRSGEAKKADIDHIKNLYFAEIAWVDDQMNKLFQHLESEGLLENSLVVITADHGEAFNEGDHHPLGHGHDIDSWVTHIPLLIVGTGRYELPQKRIKDTVKASDIPNTLLSLASFEKQLGLGRDLSPLLGKEASKLPTDLVFLEASKPRRDRNTTRWNNIGKEQGVVEDQTLFIINPLTKPKERLYTLGKKQRRTYDPETQKRLREALDSWNKRAPGYRTEKLSDEMHEALKALGYVE